MNEKEVTTTEDRGRRKVRRGVVASNKMTKTVVVVLSTVVQHPLYGKTVKKSKRIKAHDELSCDIGDTVEVMETRPISKEKHWRVSRIVEKVK